MFTLDPDGVLQPPFLYRYWPDKAQPFTGRERAAKCIEHDHPAPAEGCTCGSRATVDLSELLAAVTGRTFTGGGASILAATGVLARVLLEGRILIGVGMPADDPPTTWRGS